MSLERSIEYSIELSIFYRIWPQMNDPERNSKFVKALSTSVEGFAQPPTCLCLTELSLLPLVACR